MRKLLCLILVFTAQYQISNGSGYQVLLQGNRTTGMGNLSVAMSGDASSVFFNPGALSFLKRNSVMVGFNPIFSNNAFYNSTAEYSNYTANTDNPMGTPFHIYAVWGPENSRFRFGLGLVTPFGSGVNWGSEWMGKDLLNEISLRAIQAQPTVSYKLSDKLSVGGGLVLGFGNVSLSKTLLLDGEDGNGTVELEGKAKLALGYNLGIFYKPTENISLGINYRSKVDMELNEGDATFSVPSSLSPLIPAENKFDASLPLPSVLGIGISWNISDKLELGTEMNFVGWSAYDSLIFDFATNTPRLSDSRSPRKYENSWIWHIGGEYKLKENLQLRAGFYYDKTPVQAGYMTAETPDANRIGLTAGIGYSINENLQLDLSFLFINSETREQSVQDVLNAGTLNPDQGTRDVMPGTYKLNAYIPGFSLSYKF